ncbi:MAG TPA: hypothetical protein VEC11_13160 [Allosphingosinicella sp.]|nr:hypothetical protein [Allosphingosinicella sp.]
MITGLLAATLLYAHPAQLDCPLAEMTAAERTALEQVIVEQRPNTDPRTQSVHRVAQLCAGRFDWPPDATGRATGYVFVAVAVDLARRRLVAHGIDVASLERRLAADQGLQDVSADLNAARAAALGFVERNRRYMMSLAGPQSRQSEEKLTMMGIYIASRFAMASIRSWFADR